MKYQNVLKKTREAPIFKISDMGHTPILKEYEFVQLHQWLKQGKLVRLKRGLYTLPESERKAPLSPLWLANQLYWPSYISLEYALSAYDLIPEAVGHITSVTTRKTNSLANTLGTFSYRSINEKYFFGYKTIKTREGQSYWMAEPEKAILDFIHIAIPRQTIFNAQLFFESYRLQNVEQFKIKALKEYLTRFKNARVQKAGLVILDIVKKHKK